MPRQINTNIEINASPEKVWGILSDTASYPDWNPFIVKIEGELKVGQKFSMSAQLPGKKPMALTPVLTRFDPNQGLTWIGKIVAGAIFAGEHWFTIEPVGEGKTRFGHGENFSGILAPLILATVMKDAEAVYRSLNEAMKARAEAA